MSFDVSGNYNGNFDYDTQAPLSVMVDAIAAANASRDDERLIPIISETDGGIIAYAIGLDHATAIVRALNAAEGEYEAELVATIANANGAGDAGRYPATGTRA